MPLPIRRDYIRNRQSTPTTGSWTINVPRPVNAQEGDWLVATLCIGSNSAPVTSTAGWNVVLNLSVNSRAILVLARKYEEDDPSTYPLVINSPVAGLAAEVGVYAISDAADYSNWVIGTSWRRPDHGGSQATTQSLGITVPNETLVMAMEIEASNAIETNGSEVVSGATKWFGSPDQTTASIAIERVLISYLEVPTATTTGNVTTTWLNASLNGAGIQIGIPYEQSAPPTGEYVRDTFERTSTGSWGVADLGGTWTSGSNTGALSVQNGKGLITLSLPNESAYGRLNAESHDSVDYYAEWSVNAIPIGANLRPRFITRFINGVGDYHVRGTLTPAGVVDFRWYRDDTAALGSVVTLPGSYQVNKVLKIRAQTYPDSPTVTRLRARMWYADESEPTTWAIDITDATSGYQTAGIVSIYNGLGTGATGGPYITSFDNLIVGPRLPDATSATGNIGFHVIPYFTESSLRVGAMFHQNSLPNQIRIYTDALVLVDTKSPTINTSKWGNVDFTGLTPNTNYRIKFFVNSIEQTDASFIVKTLPIEANSFKIVAGSCQFTGSSHPVFTRIAQDNPLFIAHMGDLHYQDATTETAWRTALETSLGSSTMAPMLEKVPFSWTWDNHDRIIVDTLNMGTTSPLTLPAWREVAGTTGWSSSNTMGRSWKVGRVRFIQTDQWTVRDDPDLVAEPRTFLGAAQKQWWKDTLLASTEPVIIWFCQWTAQNHANGRWNSFNAETTELENWLNANPSIKERLILIGGDSHQLQADSGRRTKAQGSRFAGMPSLNVSGFNRSSTGANGGNWDIAEGDVRASTELESGWGAYSRLSFEDDGITISMLWEAVRVNPVGAVDIIASWERKTGTTTIDGKLALAQYYRTDQARIQPLSIEIPE